MRMEEKIDTINGKHSIAHAPSLGNKRTDNTTNAGHVTYYRMRRFSDNLMALSEEEKNL